MSPSTGQAEYVPKSETANINNQSWTSQNSDPTYSTAGGDIAEHSSAVNAGNQATTSPQNAHESTSEQSTYAAVDTSKKKLKTNEHKDVKCKAEETPPIPPLHTVEELYTAVQKKPKNRSNAHNNKDEAPQPHAAKEMQTTGGKPSQSATEDLYTAVMKNPKDSSADDSETAPPIPPHIVEELYTAVMKKPNSGAEDEEEAPPIPPYTATQ